ncbi:hypothetical protein BBJ28_00015926 [Nothophytophthora sp. Chile5]|nr:hypothetical protein BBJ28_00015926 [Nothophytophthora sp. Chile5]
MALPSSTPAEPHARDDDGGVSSHKQRVEKPNAADGGNNDQLLVAPSLKLQEDDRAQPEAAWRSMKASAWAGDLSDSDASALDVEQSELPGGGFFVLDGERFYDAVGIVDDGHAAVFEAQGESEACWGLQVDSESQTAYYFNHLRPEEMQWLPPAELSTPRTDFHPDTHEVLLWDASAQWFYYYCPQVRQEEEQQLQQEEGLHT